MIQVITRKAYGGAYVVMSSKSIGADLGLRLALGRAGRHGLAGRGRDRLPHRARGDRGPRREGGRRSELIEDYTERYANPYIAAERGYVDDVIDPAETRRVLTRSLEMLSTKREELPKRKHGNMPL